MKGRRAQLKIADIDETVSTLTLRPREATHLFLMAHGAGAGIEHWFMEDVAQRLADRGMATYRFHFPYMEAGKKRPDSKKKLLATWRAAYQDAREKARGVPLLVGGKSMGGRITAAAVAEDPQVEAEGVVFLGFPLHPPGREEKAAERAAVLEDVTLPMLFLQGTRDKLADLVRIRGVVEGLGRRATLHVVEGGDHSFEVLKRSGRTTPEVLDEVADTIVSWAGRG